MRVELIDTLWKQQPLQLEPFLPADNAPAIMSPEFAWMRHASVELQRLLTLRFPRFASHALCDPKLRCFLDTFLRYRRRYFDALRGGDEGDSGDGGSDGDKDDWVRRGVEEEPILAELDRRVFMVYLRLVQRLEDGGEYRLLSGSNGGGGSDGGTAASSL